MFNYIEDNTPSGRGTMNTKTSIYLDFMRCIAAIAVLIDHFQGYLAPFIPNFIAGHGDEGVAAFFVISGFVMRFTAEDRDKNLKNYAIARLARLYSVIPLALLVTYISDKIGIYVNQDYYKNIAFYNPEYITSLLYSISFTNEIWGVHSVFGSNEAYWSLGFEVQYYILFGVAYFVPIRKSIYLIAIWCIFVGPTILLSLPIWVLGVAVYKIVRVSPWSRPRPCWGYAFFLSSLIMYALVKVFFHDWKTYDVWWPSRQSYLFLVGISVALNIVSFSMFSEKISINSGLESTIKYIANRSFTIYIMHQPLMTLGHALIPALGGSILVRFALLAAIISICLLLSELGERRKAVLTRFLRHFSKERREIVGSTYKT